jgi:hypothetical protein
MSNFRIRDVATGYLLPGMPTPRLIEAGGGEAYFVPATDAGKRGTIWYLVAPGYEAPDGVSRRVRVEHTESWRVDVTIQPTSQSDEDVEEYRDYFIVEAATEAEAVSKARDISVADVDSQYGEEYGSIVSIISARHQEVLT